MLVTFIVMTIFAIEYSLPLALSLLKQAKPEPISTIFHCNGSNIHILGKATHILYSSQYSKE